MLGKVYKSTGKHYLIKDENGDFLLCQLKGKLKIDKEIKSSNPVAVGDNVIFEKEKDHQDKAIISEILPRENYIVRVSPQNRNQKHILASNLDLVLIIASIKNPRTSLGFIDRLLVTAEAYHVQPIIVINKIDLLSDQDEDILSDWLIVYRNAGYKILTISATDSNSILELNTLIKDKNSLVLGHSGVGKSTLMNMLMGQHIQKTQEVSDWSGKGQHTTTFAERMDLPHGGTLIDTPGIKEFGIIDFDRAELAHYFPEFREVMSDCKFYNCTHLNEPGCAVKKAVSEGKIPIVRIENYLAILASIPKDDY